ncbi:unnamed protein product, partial [Ectocarpus sp. 12 AP-2014]
GAAPPPTGIFFHAAATGTSVLLLLPLPLPFLRRKCSSPFLQQGLEPGVQMSRVGIDPAHSSKQRRPLLGAAAGGGGNRWRTVITDVILATGILSENSGCCLRLRRGLTTPRTKPC